MRLIYLSLSWVAGISLGLWAGFHWAAAIVIPGLAILALVLRRRRALLLAVCLVALLGGILRFQSTVAVVDDSTLSFYNDTGTVRVRGLVDEDPETTNGTVRLRLEATEMRVGEEWREVSGAALVYASRYSSPDTSSSAAGRDPPYYRYGDLLEVSGRLETPPEFDGFDWRDYLARRGIRSVITYPEELNLLASGQGFKPREWLYDLRNQMSGSLERALHEPEAALAQAILLGKRSTIPDELRESFSRTGTAHMIAISGLHLAIVGGIMLSALVWLFGRRRSYYFTVAVGFIWLYAALTGLHPPVLRAAIMVSLWLFADYVGRPRSGATVLCFAAAVMAGIKPSILGEVSFQMSFAAMAGVILLTPRFQALGRRILRIADDERNARTMLVDALSFTMGAYLATMPVIAYYFHHVSLVALPANLVALPALPFAIGAAALVGMVGLVASPLAWVLGWTAWLFVGFMVEVVEFFSALSFASIDMQVGAPLVWAYYAVLAAALWVAVKRTGIDSTVRRIRPAVSRLSGVSSQVPAKFAAVPLLVIAALIWTAAFAVPDDRLHVYFLDVGQGDAILISRGHQQVLVDGGPDAERIGVELGNRLPFWDRTIELVILTHPEADHVTGLVEVLRRYEVERVLTSGQDGESSIYREWRRLIDEKGVAVTVARAGQRIMLTDGMTLEVLHPPSMPLQETSSDVNNNSVVARLVFGDFSLLLAGDIYAQAELDLLDRRLDLRSAVLKVPHHGSDSSSCPEFLDAVDPRLAVVSAGADNRFGHPSLEVAERLTEVAGEDRVYVTSERGTIELTTDGERMWVRSTRSAPPSLSDD